MAAGCSVDTTVTVDVHDDGAGTVSVVVALDGAAVEAAEAGGGKLEDRVRLGDLPTAGWTVGPWVRGKDGDATITLTKPFGAPDQVAEILREVSGTSGPLRDVRATRDRGLLSTRTEVDGALDLSKLETGITADPDLLASLTGQQVDVAALDQSLTEQLRDSVSVKLVVKLPGGTTTIVGAPGTSVPIDASASVLDTRRIALLALAVVLALAAVVVVLRGGGRRRRIRRAERGEVSPTPGSPAPGSPAPGAPTPSSPT